MSTTANPIELDLTCADSSPLANPQATDYGNRPRLPLLRWVCLGVLLLIELTILSARFDLRSGPSFFHIGLAILSDLSLAAVAASLVFGGTYLGAELRRLSAATHPPVHMGLYLLGHLATFTVFVALTSFVLEGAVSKTRYFEWWIAIWGILGLISLLLWASVALPPDRLLLFFRRSRPIFILGVMVGAGALVMGELGVRLWKPLGHWTISTVQMILGLFTSETVCRPETFSLGTPSFVVHIAPSCSGYQGIGLMWMFLCIYLHLYRRSLRFPQAFLLLPLGTIIIWLANALRIAILILIGTWWSPGVALGGFHSQAGWLSFNAVALGLIVLTRYWRFFSISSPVVEEPNPTVPYLAPLLAILATGMVIQALTGGFDWLYPLVVVAAAATGWYFRRQYAFGAWSWSWWAVALGAVGYILWILLDPGPSGSDKEIAWIQGLKELPVGWSQVWLFLRTIGCIIAVPIAEELAFRGYLIRRLIAPDFTEVPLGRFTWFSFLGSSILFGAMHSRWFAAALTGILYALALYHRRRLADATLAHVTTNALISAQVLLGGAWHLWI